MKSSDEKNKSKDKTDAKEIKKKIEKLQICPYCQSLVEFIWVHGHYQCPRCNNVVVSCCGDN